MVVSSSEAQDIAVPSDPEVESVRLVKILPSAELPFVMVSKSRLVLAAATASVSVFFFMIRLPP